MTATDVTALVTTLRAALRADGSLPFSGALVGSGDLDALLRVYFTGGIVTVSGARVEPSADGRTAEVAGTVTYGAAACAVGLDLTPASGDVTLVLTLTPPTAAGGWTLPSLFPSVLDPTLSGLTFTAGGLVICSADHPVSGPLTLPRGMSLVAMLDLVKSYPLLTVVLGELPVPVHGVVTDPGLPQLVLVTEHRTASLGPIPLGEVTMTFTLGNIAAPGETAISLATATMQAQVSLAPKISGTVTAELPTGSSLLLLDVTFANANLGDLSPLKPYIGPADPVTSLPAEISSALQQAGSAFELTSLALTFDTAAVKLIAVSVVVTINLKGFTPFSVLPKLKIDDLVITFGVDLTASPVATVFSATADIEVTAACRVALGVKTQPGGDYLIFISQPNGSVLPLGDLVTDFLPGLVLPKLNVTGLAIALAPRDDLYSFSVTVDGEWTVLQDLGIELATVSVAALYAGQVTPHLSGSVTGVLALDVGTPESDPPPPIDLILSATRPPGLDGWLLRGATGPDQIVPVGDLMAALARKFGVSPTAPAAISDLTLQNLSVQFDTVKQEFEFGCQLDVSIEGEPVDIVVTVSVTKKDGRYDVSFGGTVRVGPLEFGLYFDNAGASTSLVAVYTHRPGDPAQIALRDLVGAISKTAAAAVPGDISIQLDGVKLVLIRQESGTEFAFSLDLSLSLGLADLPLVGSALPSESVSIEHLQLMYSTGVLTAEQAANVNGRLPGTVAPLPAAGLSPGAAVAASLRLGGGDPKAIAFGVPSSGTTAPQPSLEAGTSEPTGSGPADPEDAVTGVVVPHAAAGPVSQPTGHWFDVNKSFGPVSISRIGLRYQDSELIFLLDASLSLAALTVGLDGLGLGSPLSRFEPEVHLDGLSISFSDGPVSISGAFLVVRNPPAHVTDEYLGELTIAVEPYLITGVGAYAKVEGSPSFFVFAEVDGEFGGPPAFFVTGFMGGIGYNWTLKLPPADQVYQFPFIAGLGNPATFGSANPTPVEVLDKLSGQGGGPAWVSPSLGDNWLAAGLQFTSFELILGRALLVAEFGHEFELALLGLATIALPQDAVGEAYAYAELQLEVVLKPDDGVFSAVASLTPNSYLLSKQCHLTGGFAFFLWFGSNPHAGDFVLTLGGYHPAFTPPAWYPSAAPVGLNWTVDDSVVIKGGVYFAVTPTAAMAGGRLEVLFQSGDLKAWLTAYANLMIRWRPFYLTAEVGISVGVSYRLSLALTSVVVSAELGATLRLWGPPTGGVVHVDWYILSFTIGFGAPLASPSDLTLDWAGFQALLPSASGPAIVTLAITGGLRGTDKATGRWIVRADELQLTAASAIPLTSVSFGRPVTLPERAPATIHIRPMSASNVTSALTVTVSGADLATWPVPSIQTAALPEALWGTPVDDTAAPAPTANLIGDLPAGLVFAPPPATAGAAVGPVDPGVLLTPLGAGYLPLSPASQADPIAEPVADSGSIQLIADGVASGPSVRAQRELIDVLARYQAAPPTSAPLTRLGHQAGAVFAQPPMRTA